MTSTDLKKGSAELLILSLIEPGPPRLRPQQAHRTRSRGAVRFNVASLYPLLYRLEKRGWIQGRWVEKAGQRRRRYYRLTPEGKKGVEARRRSFAEFVAGRAAHRGARVCLTGSPRSVVGWPASHLTRLADRGDRGGAGRSTSRTATPSSWRAGPPRRRRATWPSRRAGPRRPALRRHSGDGASRRPPATRAGPTRGGRWLGACRATSATAFAPCARTPVHRGGALTLALGIGANAADLQRGQRRPAPAPALSRSPTDWSPSGDRLPQMGLPVVNYPDAFYVYFRNRSHMLENITIYTSFEHDPAGAGDPERLGRAAVTVDFFRLLGRIPLHGRTFLPEEEAARPRPRGGPELRPLAATFRRRPRSRREGAHDWMAGPAPWWGSCLRSFDFPAATRHTELWVPLGIDPQSLNCWCFSTDGPAPPRTEPRATRPARSPG